MNAVTLEKCPSCESDTELVDNTYDSVDQYGSHRQSQCMELNCTNHDCFFFDNSIRTLS